MNNNYSSGSYPSGSTNYGMNDTGEAVRQLNSLLRGEISAMETYRMAIDKTAGSNNINANVHMLQQMYEEHARSVRMLRERVMALGGEPSDSSGAWGAWAQTVQGTMNLFGDASALKGLKEGEEHGLKDYREAIDDVDSSSASLIEQQLIPAQEKHINLLDQLIGSVGRA